MSNFIKLNDLFSADLYGWVSKKGGQYVLRQDEARGWTASYKPALDKPTVWLVEYRREVKTREEAEKVCEDHERKLSN